MSNGSGIICVCALAVAGAAIISGFIIASIHTVGNQNNKCRAYYVLKKIRAQKSAKLSL